MRALLAVWLLGCAVIGAMLTGTALAIIQPPRAERQTDLWAHPCHPLLGACRPAPTKGSL